MKFKNIILMTLAFVFTTHVSLNANTLLTGNDVPPDTFTATLTNLLHDPCAGTVYAGVGAGAGTSVVSCLPFDATTFVPIAFDPVLTSFNQNCLDIPDFLHSPAPYLVTLSDILGAPPVNAIIVSTDGTTVVSGTAPLDAAGAANGGALVFGNVGDNVCTVAGGTKFIFMFIEPNANGFGVADGGISVMTVDPDTLALDVVNAETGVAGGNRPLHLSFTTMDSAGNPPRVTAGSFYFGVGAGLIAANVFDGTDPNLHWDERLQRLYVGGVYTTPAVATKGVKYIASLSVESSGRLTAHPMVPDAAITLDDSLSTNNMIGHLNAGAATENGGAIGLATMHTSTGFPYIIYNGGPRGAAGDLAEDRIYALPLINDPGATTALFGTVCDNTVSATGFFDTTATTASINATTLNVLRRAEVGRGRFPTTATGATSLIYTMRAIGDCVYVSTGAAAFTAGTELTGIQPGIFRSQAQFDHLGRIVDWTPWEQIHPLNLFGDSRSGGYVLEPTTGRLITTGAAPGTGPNDDAVRRTDWNTGAVATDLATNLNTELSDGAFSALDLHNKTRGFGSKIGKVAGEVTGRYTLFGGNSKVVIVRPSFGANVTVTETIQTDFTAATATNFRVDTLPGSPGPVRVMEYSRRLPGEGAQNYFFAGTPTGLFAFAATAGGGGFTAADAVNALNAAPFTASSWQKVGLGAESLGSNFIVDIKTQGQILYCITCERVAGAAPRFRLLRIPFLATIGTMFAGTNITTIADSLSDDFADAGTFNAMEIFTTGDADGTETSLTSKEQLCLATNNGLFHTRATQGAGAAAPLGTVDALNQAAMNWTRYPGSEGIHFTSIAAPNSRVRHTVWPVGAADDAATTFERSRIYQTSGNGDATGSAIFFSGDDTSRPGSFDPNNFNAEAPYNPDLETVGLINNFCTDGARRFLSVTEKTDLGVKQKLQILPFQTGRYCAGTPITVSTDPAFAADTTEFNGCTMTGWLGELLVLTDKGVVTMS